MEVTGRGPEAWFKVWRYRERQEKNWKDKIKSERLGDASLEITKKDGKTQTGFSILPSAYISIEKRTAADGTLSFYISGGGYGHGAGMSQNGAQEMAKDGKDYQTILSFFYEGAELLQD